MSRINPVQTSKTDLGKTSGSLLATPKGLSAGRGWDWIVEGFGFFKKSPGAWILTVIVYLVLSIVLSLIPVLGSIALMLIAYILFAGFMIGCSAQARGENFEVKHLFAGFSNNAGALILLSVVAAVATLLILGVTMGPALLPLLQLDGQGDQSQRIIELSQSLDGMILSLLIASLFIIPLSMAILFAPALIALNEQELIPAMKLSFIGCLKNILPFLVWGILALLLYILGCLPVFLGLLVVIPTLIASVYVAYREIFIG